MSPQMPPERCFDCPLRSLSAFSPAQHETIREIAAHWTGTRHYRNGEFIFRVGDAARNAYTLFDGHAITYRLLNGGERQVVRFLLPGDLMLNIGGSDTTWGESAQAVDFVITCVLSAEVLNDLFTRNLYIAQAIALITEHEKGLLEERITDLGRRPATDRVVRLLLELFHRRWARGGTNGTRCYLPFSQEQIGDAVGLSSVYVSRVLSQLQAQGVLSMGQRWLEIPDFDATARRFDYSPSYLQPRPLI